MARYRAAVFDFDGTLVDTREPILAGLRHALAARGRTPPPDAETMATGDAGKRVACGVIGTG